MLLLHYLSKATRNKALGLGLFNCENVDQVNLESIFLQYLITFENTQGEWKNIKNYVYYRFVCSLYNTHTHTEERLEGSFNTLTWGGEKNEVLIMLFCRSYILFF